MTKYSGISKTEKRVIIFNVCQNKEYISMNISLLSRGGFDVYTWHTDTETLMR